MKAAAAIENRLAFGPTGADAVRCRILRIDTLLQSKVPLCQYAVSRILVWQVVPGRCSDRVDRARAVMRPFQLLRGLKNSGVDVPPQERRDELR
jgi:hypothetical protein